MELKEDFQKKLNGVITAEKKRLQDRQSEHVINMINESYELWLFLLGVYSTYYTNNDQAVEQSIVMNNINELEKINQSSAFGGLMEKLELKLAIGENKTIKLVDTSGNIVCSMKLVPFIEEGELGFRKLMWIDLPENKFKIENDNGLSPIEKELRTLIIGVYGKLKLVKIQESGFQSFVAGSRKK